MNRRSFFRRTLGAIAAAALAPLLPSTPTPIFTEFVEPGAVGEIAAYQILWMGNLLVQSPRQCKMIYGITD